MRRTFLFHHGMPTRSLSLIILGPCVLLLWWFSCLWAADPITPSGLHTQVGDPVSIGPITQYDITGGTRPGGGSGTNLFHSFGDFSVPTNNIANFLNTGSVDLNGHVLASNLPTSNILSRVTGGDPSTIFGMIQTNGPNGFGTANLFLMNPAGFLFGPNAAVNVGGMMTFTTADYLRFQGIDTPFNKVSTPESLSLLSTVPVEAFGFLGSNPTAITIQGSTLQVAQGHSLSFVGGNQGFTTIDPDTGNQISAPGGVTMTGGKLLAFGGQINLVTVASSGEVSAVDFMPSSGMTMGNINLSQGSKLDVSGDSAGTVRIRGGQFQIADATISADTENANGAPTAVDIQVTGDVTMADTRGVSTITARTTGTGDAGTVNITSTNLQALSSMRSLFSPIDTHFAIIDTHTSGSGTAGTVSIKTTGNLNVTGQPTGPLFFIDSGTVGLDGGHGGDVTMTAENIRLQNANISTGDEIAINSLQDSSGSGGHVTITADTLAMTRSVISTDGFWAGQAGDLTITVRDIDMNTFSGLSLLEFEGGGKLTIIADRLIADSAQFDSETVFGPGGGFTITAKVVELKNGTTLRSQTVGDGDAGDIRITATDHLTLADRFTDPGDLTTLGARVRPTGLYTNSLGNSDLGTLGNAGSIFVTTPRLEMSGGARINSTTQSSGHGGDVIITATNQITISGERPTEVSEEGLFGLGSTRASGIYTRTVGSEFCTGACGDAGHVSIMTGSLNLSSGALINSGTTNTGRGGDVTVHATDTISIFGTMADGTSGGVFSQTVGTEPDSGNGGTISITGQSVSLSNGAEVSADTIGAGAGGSIDIGAGSTFASNSSTVSSTATQAQGGDIKITAGQSATLNNGSSISASSTGAGNAGDIVINAGQTFLASDSSVTTQANLASGGTIKITTTPSGTVELSNSLISASVLNGAGGGGSVEIDPLYVLLQNSQILAQAVQGPGGNITINITNGGLFLPDANSTISASSQFGVNGTVTIQSPNAPVSGQIQPLGKSPLLATSLLNQRCAALAEGEFSSFSVAGRDSLPTEPGNWLTSPLAFGSAGTGDGTLPAKGVRAGIDDNPAREATVLSLRQIAPVGFLTQAFAVDSSAGCQS